MAEVAVVVEWKLSVLRPSVATFPGPSLTSRLQYRRVGSRFFREASHLRAITGQPIENGHGISGFLFTLRLHKCVSSSVTRDNNITILAMVANRLMNLPEENRLLALALGPGGEGELFTGTTCCLR